MMEAEIEQNPKHKYYWEFRDRLDELGHFKIGKQVLDLIEKQNRIMIQVIKEFSEKHG